MRVLAQTGAVMHGLKLVALAAALASTAFTQTIYMPGGTVGTSSTGYVGVGTSSPDAALDVIRPGNANVYESGIRANRPDAQGQYAFMGYGQSSADAYFGSVYTGIAGTYGQIFFRQYTQGMTARDAMMINTAGDVGIGTTNPLAKLHVAGSSRFDSTINIGNAWINLGAGAAFKDGGAAVVNFYKSTGSAVQSRINLAGGSSFFNAAGGNVGIGTTSPTHKLAVNGTIRAKEVIVDTGWSDYVFAEDYRLAPLTEVEAHIREHGHLPGVPSEAQVAKEGISLGAMQAKLLAKVEELTLHVIAQEKRNNELRAEIAALRAELARLSTPN